MHGASHLACIGIVSLACRAGVVSLKRSEQYELTPDFIATRQRMAHALLWLRNRQRVEGFQLKSQDAVQSPSTEGRILLVYLCASKLKHIRSSLIGQEVTLCNVQRSIIYIY
jgi:hypothetical protein